MHPITIDGTTLYYIDKNYVLTESDLKDVPNYYKEGYETAAHNPRIRRVLCPYKIRASEGKLALCLHWNDGSELPALDKLIANNAAKETDFDDALLCETVNATCLKCGKDNIVTTPFVGLLSQAKRLRSHSTSSICPNCGDSRYAAHTEVLK